MTGPCFLAKCIAGVKKQLYLCWDQDVFLNDFLDSCDRLCL